MNTSTIVRAFTNSATPAARLAAWQALPIGQRLAAIRKHTTPGYPCRPIAFWEIKSPTRAQWRQALIHDPAFQLAPVPMVHETTLHSLRLDSKEIANYWHGGTFLRHDGWFVDEDEQGDEVFMPYAVQLARFPGFIFEVISDPWNDEVVDVDLSTGAEIGYHPASVWSESTAEGYRHAAAGTAIRRADYTAQRRAEREREFQAKSRIESDIEENRETLKTLRSEIRALAHELKALCPSPMTASYPAAARALRQSLQTLLSDRRELLSRNSRLAVNL